MKAKVSLKMFVLSAALLVVSLATSARSYDNQLIYNPIEENGMTVGQTVYKMDGNTLANYMKYNYKYDDNKRMIESEALKWNSSKDEWEKDLSNSNFLKLPELPPQHTSGYKTSRQICHRHTGPNTHLSIIMR